MQSRSSLQVLYAVLALMVAQAHCQQLMCYICDDCSKITQDTPKEICDESFFSKFETTQPPATTETTITTDEIITTTTEGITETITPETTISTKPPMPTAGTAGPPLSTTLLPTPPNPGTVAGPINAEVAVFNTTENSTTPIPATGTGTAPTTTTTTTEIFSTNDGSETTFLRPIGLDMQPAQIRVRQLRSVFNPLVSYHCYVVQKTINETLSISRGCSRVNQTEAVCPALELANNNTKFDKCTPCSNSLCNGSNVFGVSFVAVILGLASAFLLRFSA